MKAFKLAALRSILCTVSLAVLATGAAAAEADPSPAPEPSSTAVTSARSPDESERKAMVQILSSEKGQKASFLVTPGNAEAEALANDLKGIFEEAGWKADVTPITGMMLKPGVSMLAADEEPPAWVAVVQHALQQSGIDVKFGSGYRPYYDEKKKEDPKWVGVPITKDQAFVIVVGPEPGA